MSRFTKKDRERMFLDAFLASEDVGPVQSIDHDDKPDFVIALFDRTLGVEIREVLREPAIGLDPHREQESLRWQLVELAQAIWNKKDLPPIHASVHFNPHHPLKADQLREVAETLVAVAARNIPRDERSTSIKGVQERPRQLPAGVHTLGIHRFAFLDEASWVPADSGWVPSISPQQIQTLIDQKNRKRMGYRSADEYWLLLCADGFSVAGSFKLDPACRDHRFRSHFDRIGYFDLLRKSVVWLTFDAVLPG